MRDLAGYLLDVLLHLALELPEQILDGPFELLNERLSQLHQQNLLPRDLVHRSLNLVLELLDLAVHLRLDLGRHGHLQLLGPLDKHSLAFLVDADAQHVRHDDRRVVTDKFSRLQLVDEFVAYRLEFVQLGRPVQGHKQQRDKQDALEGHDGGHETAQVRFAKVVPETHSRHGHCS